jgi:hypothetical protein
MSQHGSALRPREYAVFEAGEFPCDVEEIRARRWGVLHCTDTEGRHWSVLGDYGYCVTLRALGGGDNGRVPMSPGPLDGFKPEWILPFWPDEWPEIAASGQVLPVIPWDAWEEL